MLELKSVQIDKMHQLIWFIRKMVINDIFSFHLHKRVYYNNYSRKKMMSISTLTVSINTIIKRVMGPIERFRGFLSFKNVNHIAKYIIID